MNYLKPGRCSRCGVSLDSYWDGGLWRFPEYRVIDGIKECFTCASERDPAFAAELKIPREQWVVSGAV